MNLVQRNVYTPPGGGWGGGTEHTARGKKELEEVMSNEQ